MKNFNCVASYCHSTSILRLVFLVLAVICANGVFAQDMISRSMSTRAAVGSESAKTRSEEYNPLGIHAGSFYFFPVLETGLTADSNVFSLPDALRESDTILFGMGSAAMSSDWNRHEFNAKVWAKGGAYQDFPSEDYLDYKITGNGRVDVARGSFFTGRAGYMHLHQNRSSLNNRGGVEPTQYDLSYFGVGYDHELNRFGMRVNLDHEEIDYQNVERVGGGIVDNEQRDRGRTEATIRLVYEAWNARNFFFQAAVNTVDYNQKVDNAGFEKSSNGYKLTTGMNFNLTSVIVGDAFIGYVEQSYDDPRYDDLSAPLLGFSLIWHATALTTLSLNLDRNPQETVQPLYAGYMSTEFAVEVNHELLRNLVLVGNLSSTRNKYEPITPDSKEKDVSYGAGLGVKYLFSRRYYARADYSYRQRTSDFEIQDYSKHRFQIAAGVNW